MKIYFAGSIRGGREDAALYFDYISPMVYPSHYGTGHFGLKSPVNNPYLVGVHTEEGV